MNKYIIFGVTQPMYLLHQTLMGTWSGIWPVAHHKLGDAVVGLLKVSENRDFEMWYIHVHG